MSARKRIQDDLREFSESLALAEKTRENERVIDLAERYARDASFFLEKGDELTAFGCINYAHGLLDALRLRRSLKKEG